MEVATVVPVKAFSLAKQRLSGTLDPPTRARLARWMAERVIAAASRTSIHIACDDDEVRDWALDLGAAVRWGPGLGLDGAVDDAVAFVVSEGADHVVVSHADLPLATPLIDVTRRGWATLVPDRRRDGTNVIAYPADAVVAAGYGPGSFRRHLARSTAIGPTEVRADPLLAHDVDEPAHLLDPRLREVLPPWLPTIPDNPTNPA
ncbi:MAG: hypothetical protein AAGD33_04705 [Actinomycetota bacterium]